MGTYMYKVHYSVDGLHGIAREGAERRANEIGDIIAKVGGKMLSFHFAFGDTDAYVINELPDDATAAALSIAVSASGAAGCETVKLLTPAEADAALAIETGYRPPGA